MVRNNINVFVRRIPLIKSINLIKTNLMPIVRNLSLIEIIEITYLN